uniref:Probable thymidylate kinase (inferred by orthology to a C. elegans protein) n=1 Tax=Strongyloides venezuelensis TaxID=75913 RepID=A0A0K0FPQ3_STRVS
MSSNVNIVYVIKNLPLTLSTITPSHSATDYSKEKLSIDKSGKTTQSKRLAEYLIGKRLKVHLADFQKMGLISPDVGLPKPDVVLFFDITPDSTRACEGFGDEIFKKKTFQDIVYKEMKNLMLKNQNICKKDVKEVVCKKLDSLNGKPLSYLSVDDFL